MLGLRVAGRRSVLAAALAGLLLSGAAGAAAPAIDQDDIGGTVTGPKGPEAGVWVIAEANLPTRFIRIVVTDDAGRYVLPDLPDGAYKVWVRGYGLVDSQPVEVKPGKMLDLTAVPAPSPKAAAEYYPAAWWYAMLEPPAEAEFPGTGPKGNGIAAAMKTQQYWLDHMKENCMTCHQLGSKVTRELEAADQVAGWANRIQNARPGPDDAASLNTTMINHLSRFGRDRALRMFADWTGRIRDGALPASAPPRPQGVERNLVVTLREWGDGYYIHDQISSDHRDPTVNSKGQIYGIGLFSNQLVAFDPKSMKTERVTYPSVVTGKAGAGSRGLHSPEMDQKGRVWTATVDREGPDQAWCRDGSTPYSKYFPLPPYRAGGATLPVYDPKTGKIEVIPICVGGNHGNFSFDKDNVLFLSGDFDVVSWFNTRVWDETHDVKQAHGWCPMVLDTNGDGKIDPDRSHWNLKTANLIGGGENTGEDRFVRGSKIDPTRDTLINVYLYGMGVAKDGSVWEAAYVPYVPSAIIRMNPGAHPPATCVTEIYEPPMVAPGKYAAYGIRGVGVDAEGVAWAAFSSGQVGSFDRRKCKVVNGPTATGQHCPEGWTIHDLPVPKVGKTSATADFVYSEWNDYFGIAGLGPNTKFFPAVNSDSVVALAQGADKFTVFRVPYPMGFYTRGMDFRIEDPNTGWKGRTMQATYSSMVPWHQEEGEGSTSKLVTFQMRPDPLAH